VVAVNGTGPDAGADGVATSGATAAATASGDADVFVTGFPGFLGTRLVERRVTDGETVACLVQARYRERAERVAADLAEGADGRVDLYEGDVTDPGLGLADRTYDRLAGAVGETFHLAAAYDLGVDRATARRVNVAGTRHVIAFARAADARLQYVSTCYVSGRYDGLYRSTNLSHGPFNNHYEATKHAAERLVRGAMADGLAATVYRPAIVVGDSDTGATQKYDGPYAVIRYLLRAPGLALLPRVGDPADAELNVVPREYVVDAIAYLSRRASAVGETYQLCDPSPPSVAEWIDLLAAAADTRVLTVPATRRLARRVLSVRPIRRATGVQPAMADYLSHPTSYSPAAARRALPAGIAPPPLASYLRTLVAYVRENPDPGVGAMF
jgi:thioester reductase-like protein